MVVYVPVTSMKVLIFEPDVRSQDDAARCLAKCEFVKSVVMDHAFDFRWVVHQAGNYVTHKRWIKSIIQSCIVHTASNPFDDQAIV